MKKIMEWFRKNWIKIEETVVMLAVLSAPLLLILRALGVNISVTWCVAPFAVLATLIGALVLLMYFAEHLAEILSRLCARWK